MHKDSHKFLRTVCLCKRTISLCECPVTIVYWLDKAGPSDRCAMPTHSPFSCCCAELANPVPFPPSPLLSSRPQPADRGVSGHNEGVACDLRETVTTPAQPIAPAVPRAPSASPSAIPIASSVLVLFFGRAQGHGEYLHPRA